MNVVATDTGTLVEIQGTGEGATFPRSTLDKMLDFALIGCEQLFEVQARAGAAVPRCAARAGGAGEEGSGLTELLVASRNRKKLAELRRVLDGAGVSLTLLSLDDVAAFDESPETGATFEDNALAKARDAFTATGLPSVADDSGIEVDALNGMPGVLSARWSGVHGDDAANTALLLSQLRDVPDARCGAAFVSACALVYGPGDQTAQWFVACGRAASRGSRAATAGSVTTRSFCPRARRAPRRS